MSKFVEPAFPTHHTDSNHGMTLRDYFAAKAMQAIIGLGNKYVSNKSGDTGAEVVSSNAYFMADAMIAEREK